MWRTGDTSSRWPALLRPLQAANLVRYALPEKRRGPGPLCSMGVSCGNMVFLSAIVPQEPTSAEPEVRFLACPVPACTHLTFLVPSLWLPVAQKMQCDWVHWVHLPMTSPDIFCTAGCGPAQAESAEQYSRHITIVSSSSSASCKTEPRCPSIWCAWLSDSCGKFYILIGARLIVSTVWWVQALQQLDDALRAAGTSKQYLVSAMVG